MNEMEKRKRVDFTSAPQQSLAYVLIGIGVVWLLVNIVGWSLWPLLLLGIGILMLTGNLRPGDVQHHHFRAPIDEAESAEIYLNLEVGETTIHPLSDETVLIDAELAHLGDVTFTVTGEHHQIINLEHAEHFNFRWLNPANWFSHHDDLKWDIGLNPRLPMQLNVNGGAGKSVLNLDGINLTDLRVKSGLGEVHLRLPATAERYDAQLTGGVGEFNINIARGAAINLDVKGGVGEFKINTPHDSGVHIEASMGVGEVKTSSRFTKIGGGHAAGVGGSGTWESDDFEAADRKIYLRFSGGLGALNVQ